MKKDDCIFCKIVEGSIPSYKVFEDDNFYGFLNIKPHIKGHTLLIPKNHSDEVLEITIEELNKYMEVAHGFAKKLKNIFKSKRVAFAFAGLEVNHTHLHLFPLDHLETFNTTSAYDASKEELEDVRQLIVSSL